MEGQFKVVRCCLVHTGVEVDEMSPSTFCHRCWRQKVDGDFWPTSTPVWTSHYSHGSSDHKQVLISRKQDSWAIAKKTARCAQYMGALKSFESPHYAPDYFSRNL